MTDETKHKTEGKSDDEINIDAEEDMAFANDNAKASPVKKSSVAVIGDNTNVKGGIHFYDKVMVCSFAVLIPFLTFIFVFKDINDNPATKPENLWEMILVVLVAIFAASAIALIVTKTYNTIKTWAILFILIPFLSTAVALASALYISSKLIKDDPPPPKDTPAITQPPVPTKDAGKPRNLPETHNGQQSEITEKPGLSESLPSSGSTRKKDVSSDSKQLRENKVHNRAAVKEPDADDDLGMKFMYIPPGTFMMGSPKEEPGRDDDEALHKVTLTRGFHMQTTEVTQKQWKAVMGSNPSYFKNCDDCPVERVSWNEVQEFIAQMNQRGEGTYHLPTEAEWEYACRAGTDTPFYFGKRLSTDEANYNGNFPLKGCPKGEYRGKTVPVASFPPNAWGLYDMHGNVWEWCEDWYQREYSLDDATDPAGPKRGSYRVYRGGSWILNAQYCRSADRYRALPGYRSNFVGFRLSREAP